MKIPACRFAAVVVAWSCSTIAVAQSSAIANLPVRNATTKALPMSDRIGSPELLIGSESQLALVDYADMTIYRANGAGQWQTSFQKVGGGPGEIARVGGMQFGAGGALWISDDRNSRVSVRGADTKAIGETKLTTPIRALAPALNGSIIGLAASQKELAVVLDKTGAVAHSVAYPADVEALNPIQRERYLVRINDTLSILQFRWFNRRVALRNDGRIAYDSGSLEGKPEVLAMKLDDKGSVGYRIAPKQASFARHVAARGDTLYVLLGSKAKADDGRFMLRLRASNGKTIDRVMLDRAVKMVAATKQGLFAVGETDDGYSLFAIQVQK